MAQMKSGFVVQMDLNFGCIVVEDIRHHSVLKLLGQSLEGERQRDCQTGVHIEHLH